MVEPVAQRVSRLHPAPGRPGRVIVFLDNQRGPTLAESRCVDLGIRVGTAWTPDLAFAAERGQRIDAAKERALRNLRARPRARADLAAALAAHEPDPAIIAEALDELTRAGLIDDAHYAQALVESQASRGPGRLFLAEQQLVRSGIKAEHIAEALHNQHTDPLTEAINLVNERRSRAPRSESARKTAARLLRLLAARGFDEHIAHEAIEATFGPDLLNNDEDA
ncbi:MAG: RecX family transcriptional regulator [Phycisphaeraceae bacterium]|nr:RecX family transcriptional regulator [Phycisphaeraceae bacterium]MCW5763575.1 RecX family transcriptional regulator [Phycisphaeraceae bacterium]